MITLLIYNIFGSVLLLIKYIIIFFSGFDIIFKCIVCYIIYLRAIEQNTHDNIISTEYNVNTYDDYCP